jgi:hypothetical protein
MFKKIALALVAVIALILIFAATRPDTFRVERSTSIKATPDKVFPLINSLAAQAQWSPWEKIDPAMKRKLSGADSGKGAVYEWDGNSEVGKGRIEITDAVAPSKVLLKLDMIEPMEGHNTVEFTLAPAGEMTKVTWAMYGAQPFIGKLVGVFIDCDKMVGGQFETGLASLKAIAER